MVPGMFNLRNVLWLGWDSTEVLNCPHNLAEPFSIALRLCVSIFVCIMDALQSQLYTGYIRHHMNGAFPCHSNESFVHNSKFKV